MRSPAAQRSWFAATIPSPNALPAPSEARQTVFAAPVAASATRIDHGWALGFE